MKKLVLMAVSASVAFAGADIKPLVDYEVQDVKKAKVEEVKQVAPAPIPIVDVAAPVVAAVVGPKKWYVGLDGLCGRFETNSGVCACLGDVVGKIGYNFNDYIGVEARAGYGISDKEHDNGGTSELKENYGIYLKPQLPLGDKASLFALAGYAKAKVESKSNGTNGLTGELDEDGVSFGLGVEYKINDSWSILAEGIRVLHSVEVENGTYVNGAGTAVNNEDDVNLDTYGLGINYRF